ncbi:carboxypeptidase regulatory-like domain-containing protein [candidate division WOR-3 bacterium]|nr:carboxypeptidase regulatory-like domain-containing protein [candidate division WOR-3 bacterium]
MKRLSSVTLCFFVVLQFACSLKHTQKSEEEKIPKYSSYVINYEVSDSSTTGKIKGKVINALNGEAVKYANIVLDGTTIGTVSDANGDYLIEGIPPDTYDVWISDIGYQGITAGDIKIEAGKIAILDIKLAPSKSYPLPKGWGIY